MDASPHQTQVDSHPAPVRARRRRPRYGLRGLLIAVTLTAVLFGVLASIYHEGKRQQDVAERLRRAGASVVWRQLWDISTDWKSTWHDGQRPRMFFHRIRQVRLMRTREADYDDQLAVLSDLGKVEAVSLSEWSSLPGITFGMQELDRLTSTVDVGSLYLSSVQLARTRLPALSRQRLTWLCVARTQFSNPAIEDLPPTLEYFDATRTRINDAGLPGFARLTRLKILNLRRTPTSPEAVEQLRERMPWCKIEWEPLRSDR